MIEVGGETFFQLGTVVIVAAVMAYILRLLRQPQIVAYVLAGVLITPILGIITDLTVIEHMSIIGIAFLLFIVGIEMDLRNLRHVALLSSVGGFLIISLLFLLGYVTALLLGYMGLEAAYIGLMMAFSSTMIVMKTLSDRRELNTLHGRIVVGILLMEDIVAVLALSLFSSLDGFQFSILGMALLKFAMMFGLAFLCSRYLFPKLFTFAARNQELLLILSLAVCFLFSLGFFYLGFSIAIGAFLAGLTLGNLRYNVEIIGKVRSLRDFFALLLFVSLGMSLSFEGMRMVALPVIVLTLFVVLLKPLLVMLICSLFKYTKKPAFLSALSLSNIGEFSLILAALGVSLGHLSKEVLSMIVLITVLSITISSYYTLLRQGLYKVLAKPLRFFDAFSAGSVEYAPTSVKPTVVLCGHNRIGYSILRDLEKIKDQIVVIDYNPEVIAEVMKQGYHCIYGDVTDEEVWDHLPLKAVTMVVSTVPEMKDNQFIINKVTSVNRRASLIVTANDIEEAMMLYKAGADYVIMPHFLGGEQVAGLISRVRTKKASLHEEKQDHLRHLQERRKMGHEHPKHLH